MWFSLKLVRMHYRMLYDTKKLCTMALHIHCRHILYDHNVQLDEGTTIFENIGIGIWYRHFGCL